MVSLNTVEYGLTVSEVLESMLFYERNSIQLSAKFDFGASKFDNNCAQELISESEKHSAGYLIPVIWSSLT